MNEKMPSKFKVIKKMQIIKQLFLVYVITIFTVQQAVAEGYSGPMKAACPKAWELAKWELPEDDEGNEGSDEREKYIDDHFSGLKDFKYDMTSMWSGDLAGFNAAKAQILSAGVIQTVDPATLDVLVNDPLTVASECLVYLNVETDFVLTPPPPIPPSTTSFRWLVPIISH